MRASGTSGSMKNISKPKVLGIEIALPSREKQDEFADCYLVIQQSMSTAIVQAAMLEDQFSSLRSRAFSGQL
jgi:type I restriction enzyme S subunit